MPNHTIRTQAHFSMFSAAALLVASVIAAPVLANTIMPKADFQSALIGAMGDRNLRNQTAAGETLQVEELNGIGSHGAWRLFITNACLLPGAQYQHSNNYRKTMRIRLPSVFANQGTQFQFAMNSQTVQPHQKERVEKALVERLQSLNREYGDLKAEINRTTDGAYQLSAQQVYGSSPSAGVTRDRIAAVISNARFMICDIYDAMELADADQWKNLRSSTLTKLDRGQFISLYPLLKESGYERTGDAPGGQWAFKLADDLTTRVENHVNELYVWVYVKPARTPSAEKLEVIRNRIRAIPAPYKAQRLEVGGINEKGFIWVALVYPYAGMTGDQFTDTMKLLIDKSRSVDFRNTVRKAMQEVE